jgi:alanine racemase
MTHSAFREAVVDLGAIAGNVRHLRTLIDVPHVLVVVKADGYGHGMVASALAALEGGADWLGVADEDEAAVLRLAGIDAPILTWIHAPDEDFVEAVRTNVTPGVVSIAQLQAVAAAGAKVGTVPTVHIKVNTGLSRNGVGPESWGEVFTAAAELEAAGALRVQGIFSHLSGTSAEDDLAQGDRFDEAVSAAHAAGLAPELIHLAASTAALTQPTLRYNMVRLGITAYGLSPVEDKRPEDFGLTPAMTVQARVAAVLNVPHGTGVSYGYLHRTEGDSTLAQIPLGYYEGIPRTSSGGPVVINGTRYSASGRVAMDQFVVDLGTDEVSVGDLAVLFGDARAGHPSVHDWAAAANTIGYEIVTRIGGRLERRYVGDV